MQFPPFRLRKHHGKIRTQIFQRSVSFRISAGENRGGKNVTARIVYVQFHLEVCLRIGDARAEFPMVR